MWNELKRRYVNTEMLFWLAGAVISQEVLLTIFLRSLQRNVSGTPCVLDVLTCMSQNYVFPLMMIIASVCNQRMMKCDRDPMIILKYSSRAGIYLWQSICTIVYSAVLSLIYELAAIAYAATKFDVFFNWNSYSSYKLMNLDVLPAGQVTGMQVMFVYWILMALMIAITCFIGIIFEIIFSSDVISGVAVIIFAGADIFIPLTYHKLIIFGAAWYSYGECARKLGIAALIMAVLIIAGLIKESVSIMNIKKKMSNKSIRGVIWHDIERGFYADRFRYLIAVLMLAGVLIILGNHEFGMMDTIFFIQGGYDPVLIIKEGKIVFPFVWMLIQFLVPFMIYSYCNDDCEGVGIDFLMKCRSRRLWWNSKCLWNCLTVLSVYVVQYATAFVYGLCNGNLSMKVNYELFEKISNKSVPDNPANVWIIVYMLVMPVVVSLVTALVQMTISMFTNPMIGMLAVMAWNVMSVFINNPLMIGNNSMVVRSSVYNAQRIQVWQSAAVCIVVYIVVYVVGMIGFNKKDILVRED